MFRTRVITAAVVLPLAILLIVLGGWWFFGLIALLLTVGTIEFGQMMQHDQYRPNPVFAIALLWVLLLDAQFPELGLMLPGISILLLSSLGWQLRSREGKPVSDWALTIAGGLYLGWCGHHFVLLRNLPDGLWWILTVLPAIWIADSGAYSFGRAWGKHKLAPETSPGKTWEGYIGGIIVGSLGAAGLASLWGLRAGPSGPTALEGLLLGLLISTLAPVGDLAISMIKRQVGVKDTSTLFPGHGGALDRVDSLLWAAVLGYYYVLWFAT
jgi:phosphatidate cytidylyltransferase